MNRMTYVKHPHSWNRGKYPTKYTSRHTFQEVVAHLAAYEDTGLMPEEITIGRPTCVFYCNRQCNLNGDFCAEGPGCPFELDGAKARKFLLQIAPPNTPLTLEELREMDGAPVVFPCKIGDLMYEVDKPEYGVITCRVLYIGYYAGPAGHVPGNPMVSTISIGVEVIGGHGKGSSYCFEQEDIGKLVFLTRQEAEDAILSCRRKPEEGTGSA